jgi:hypothetical protein
MVRQEAMEKHESNPHYRVARSKRKMHRDAHFSTVAPLIRMRPHLYNGCAQALWGGLCCLQLCPAGENLERDWSRIDSKIIVIASNWGKKVPTFRWPITGRSLLISPTVIRF